MYFIIYLKKTTPCSTIYLYTDCAMSTMHRWQCHIGAHVIQLSVIAYLFSLESAPTVYFLHP